MGHGQAAAQPSAITKCNRRLLPLAVLLVVINYLDRTALAFAALQVHLVWGARGQGGGATGLGYAV